MIVEHAIELELHVTLSEEYANIQCQISDTLQDVDGAITSQLTGRAEEKIGVYTRTIHANSIFDAYLIAMEFCA